jgi:hypothetical protein
MYQKTQRRVALAVIDNLECALTITHLLVRNEIEPQAISIIGQEASFAGERQAAIELVTVVSRNAHIPKLMVDSNRIVSLESNSETPKSIADDAEAFERMLLRWLPEEHAERLTDIIARGEFLLIVELHSLVEERVATKTLLRNCRGSVEVHDLDASVEEMSL